MGKVFNETTNFWTTTKADVVMAKKSGTSDLNSKINSTNIWNTLQDDDIFPKVADKLALYMLLFRYIIKHKSCDNDKANLFNDYYKKGKLSSCVPASTLAERTGKSERTVYRQIKDLENLGVIEIDKIKPNKSWDKQLHSIYTLGTHDLNGNEIYFIKTITRAKTYPFGKMIAKVKPALTKDVASLKVQPVASPKAQVTVLTKQSRGSDKCSG